jgi:predicted outer membrane protein
VRPPVPRFVRWALALAVMAALTLVVFQYWGTSQYGIAASTTGQAASPSPGWIPTRWGPLGPADRDLLIMIRQAGLSEATSGHQAQRQGSNPQVRTVAKSIGADCGELDNQVRSVAAKLGVPLPGAPTPQQQAWLAKLSAQAGPAYDRMFAQQVRLTDGEVLPAITAVRAGTRNELIRSLAANAVTLANRHMDVLERTGLVDYAKLPAPPAAAAATERQFNEVVNATQVSPAGPLTGNDANAMIAALVSIAALLIALGLIGSTRRRIRRPAPVAQHRGTPRRHAAHRW